MGSIIELNDTLKLSTTNGFPKELKLSRHLSGKIDFSKITKKSYTFKKPGIRRFHDGKTRVFLVQELNGKWLWGHAEVLRQEQDAVKKETKGTYRVTKLYTPAYQRQATINESPRGKSYYDR